MSLTLTPELEERVKREAIRHGMSLDEYAIQALDESLSKIEQERREKAIALLQSWIEEDESSDDGYDEEFLKMIDEDRLSERKLFPPEMKGISW